MDPRVLPGVVLSVCALFSCKMENGIPESGGVIPPLDVGALVAGNRAANCARADVEARVEAWLSAMTLEEKVSEMHGRSLVTVNGFYEAGGNDRLGIPTYRMVDGPRGVRSGNATAFPVGMARGASWDPELERRVGLAIAQEVAAKGGNVLLAPTMNLLRHPGWGRAQETYSEDSFHMGLMALAFVGGAQNHVLASAKHFAVNSIENTRFSVSANLDERTLHEVYLPHFRRVVIEGKVASVMSAYNRVNGAYAAENHELLSNILKRDWGFSGFVESDWILGVRSTVPSVLAGLDMEMPMPNYFGAPLVSAVNAGQVATRVIDEAVRRVLRQKACFELDRPAPVDPGVVESAEHVALAREVAEKSIVLLKNDARTLPLPASVRQIAVLGALADVANLGDRGSSSVTPSSTVTPYGGLRSHYGDDRVLLIPTDQPTSADLDQVARADVAIVVAGLTYLEEGEFIPIQVDGLERGGDRASLELPPAQVELIRSVGARAGQTIVVLEAGSAVVVEPWIDSVQALVMAWYPGMQGGTAIANVLSGRVNPSGKLPVSFARSMDQLPPWDITSDEVSYGYLHGYRLLDAQAEDPRFPFGFGLGYSRFQLGRLKLDRRVAGAADRVRLSVDVYNRGSRQGTEVVQVYASAPGSRFERAPRELRAFRRVELEAGAVRTVELELSVADLAVYEPDARTFYVEPLEYVLHVGTSARDLTLSARLSVK
ncbi:MAG TPA: glycoside hydrolase family 3 C-terminal domain-containing protein [Polyangiaceae bacterium]